MLSTIAKKFMHHFTPLSYLFITETAFYSGVRVLFRDNVRTYNICVCSILKLGLAGAYRSVDPHRSCEERGVSQPKR